jgi:hypothetical protein
MAADPVEPITPGAASGMMGAVRPRRRHPESRMRPDQPTHTDPATGRRYSVDPRTDRSHEVTSSGPNPSALVSPGPAQPSPAQPSNRQPSGGRRPVNPGNWLLFVGGFLATGVIALGILAVTFTSSDGGTGSATTQLQSGAGAALPPTDTATVSEDATSSATQAATTTPVTTTARRSTTPRSTPVGSTTTTRSTPKPSPVPKFADCTALRKVYPHGVGRPGAVDHTKHERVTTFTVDAAVYSANTGGDWDHDGIACEKA